MISGHVFIATSLDGFIARNNGEIDWLLSLDSRDEDHGYNSFIEDIDGIIMGRGSYEKVSTFDPWPYNKPVVVLSKSLAGAPIPQKLEGQLRFLNLSPKEAMRQMAEAGWKKVYIDGGQIIQSFLREKLIADLIVTKIPVLIGEGRPLFGLLHEDVSLTHLQTKSFPSGLVQSHYRVKT
jgi:dihydrofolate reductase